MRSDTGMVNTVKEPLHTRLGICPYCGEKLGIVERLKQKSRRVYRCNRCGKVIDERFMIY